MEQGKASKCFPFRLAEERKIGSILGNGSQNGVGKKKEPVY